MPGELNITYDLLGPENRTLARVVQGDGLNLILMDFDIVIFSDTTAYNLTFTQIDAMDVVDEYNITAEVSFIVWLSVWRLVMLCACKIFFTYCCIYIMCTC